MWVYGGYGLIYKLTTGGGHHIVHFPAENADLSRSRATWQTTHGLGLHGYETSVSTFNVAMALTILDDPNKKKRLLWVC